MVERANVTSLEQLGLLCEAILTYRGKMGKELEALGVELRRLTNWIQDDARNYWAGELTTAQRQFMECQDALVRCQSYVREDERRPCTEEKKRFEKAKKRRVLCEQMLRMAAAAAAKWEQEQNKNMAKVHRLRDLVESDLQAAVNLLSQDLTLLESYAQLKSPVLREENETPSSLSSDSVASDTSQPEDGSANE